MRKLSPDIYIVNKTHFAETIFTKPSINLTRIQFRHIQDCSPDHADSLSKKGNTVSDVAFDENIGRITNHTVYLNERPRDTQQPYLALNARNLGRIFKINDIIASPSLIPPTVEQLRIYAINHNCVRDCETATTYQTVILPNGQLERVVNFHRLVETDDFILASPASAQIVNTRPEPGLDEDREPFLFTQTITYHREHFNAAVGDILERAKNEFGQLQILTPDEVTAMDLPEGDEQLLPEHPVMIVLSSTRPPAEKQLAQLHLTVTRANSRFDPC